MDPRDDSAAAEVPASLAKSGTPEDDATTAIPSSRPANKRAASNSNRMRGEIAPVILASVALIVSAICVSADQSQSGSLTTQIIHVLGGRIVGKHAFRTLSAQREHQQIAYAGKQILNKSTGIETTDHDLLNHAIQCFAIFVGNGVDGLADQSVRREAKQRNRGVVCDAAIDRTDHELVKHGKGVSHGTAAGTHGKAQHAGSASICSSSQICSRYGPITSCGTRRNG